MRPLLLRTPVHLDNFNQIAEVSLSVGPPLPWELDLTA